MPTHTCIRLACQPTQGFRPVSLAGPGESIRKFGILSRLVERAGLPLLFAEPVNESGRLEWHTHWSGPVVAYLNLSAAQQPHARRVLSLLVGALYDFARTMPDVQATRLLLDECLQIPSLDDLLLIGRMPVLLNWGFLQDDFNPPSGLIHRLAGQIPVPRLWLNLTVEREDTGLPVPDFAVTWVQVNRHQSELTDASGQLTIELAARDPLQLRLELIAPGYETILEMPNLPQPLIDLVWEESSTLPLTLRLRPLPPPIVRFVLNCVDVTTAQPVAGAFVRWQAGDQTEILTSDSSGDLYFETALPDGTEQVVAYVSHPDYADERLELKADQLSQIATVRLTALSAGGLRGQRGMLSVNLSWETFDDLDLLVTDPAGNLIHFGNPMARIGDCIGQLDLDANAEGTVLTAQPQENIFWERAAPGSYTIAVMLYRKRSVADEIAFTVTVNNRNNRAVFSQTVQREQVQQIVTRIDFQAF